MADRWAFFPFCMGCSLMIISDLTLIKYILSLLVNWNIDGFDNNWHYVGAEKLYLTPSTVKKKTSDQHRQQAHSYNNKNAPKKIPNARHTDCRRVWRHTRHAVGQQVCTDHCFPHPPSRMTTYDRLTQTILGGCHRVYSHTQ